MAAAPSLAPPPAVVRRLLPCRVTDSENDNRQPLKCQFPHEIGRSQASRRQQAVHVHVKAKDSPL
ncbi:hypothetical protein F511_24543 [Dorcoceras hygrometricum]|uniref:Uncharacterized protein n=1 Tax=Dorcoceras hygrometricum TaxID=472368 RepID=A0A2Z7CRW1_9LAMI|nr:hypothetical protein F511_24543 [Dorcoceras hygrometricum]